MYVVPIYLIKLRPSTFICLPVHWDGVQSFLCNKLVIPWEMCSFDSDGSGLTAVLKSLNLESLDYILLLNAQSFGAPY